MNLGNELKKIIAPDRVLTRPIDLIAYASDASVYRLIPKAVVQPSTVQEIRELFALSSRARVPVTFRAAGTSLSGQAVTDGILVDISKYWRRISVDDDGSRVRLQPGTIGGVVNNILRPYGAKLGPDPASINACMMGGILANNASGMCCGVSQNSYHTLESLTFVLPNGNVTDTAAAAAAESFRTANPDIAQGLQGLRRQITDNGRLSERIRDKYRRKNTTGYSLNAFLDYSESVDIMRHLLIGSEGTLGYIAEAVMRTVPDLPLKYTGLLFFPDIQAAGSAIVPLRNSGAAALELMDRAALRSVADQSGALAEMKDLPDSAAAILVEYQCDAIDDLQSFKACAAGVFKDLSLVHPPDFTEEPKQQAALWQIRKGLFPSVGAVRELGTSVIIEDVVFPVERLDSAVTDLQALFEKHGYAKAIIFGHARDGNIHFVITQSFHEPAAVNQYDMFIRDVVSLVVDKYDGAIKAEHGTGRNMAPFVETEWGADAYAIMKSLKSLIDPDNLLNPDVIVNSDPNAHIKNLKSLPTVDPESDTCIECGFCEPKCPSRDLTLTPRQRIVVRREIARLRAGNGDDARLRSLMDDYAYDGVETCAADGLCATACPVRIDTGLLVKRLRKEAISDAAQRRAVRIAGRLGLWERLARAGLRLGHLTNRFLGARGVNAGLKLLGAVTGTRLPQWSEAMPTAAPGRIPSTSYEGAAAVYFPSCVARVMGKLPGEAAAQPLADTLVTLGERAGKPLWIPPACAGHCCGVPFSSKGYRAAYEQTVNDMIAALWEWSDSGRMPVVIDTSPCTYTLNSCRDDLTPANQKLHDALEITDSVAFVHDHLLGSLQVTSVDADVVLHPVCSLVKMDLTEKLLAVAKRCARTATIPIHAGCCGFAGDRGLLFPELTRSATKAEAEEVRSCSYGGYYSSSRTCELGMTIATGETYQSILYLVERATRDDREK